MMPIALFEEFNSQYFISIVKVMNMRWHCIEKSKLRDVYTIGISPSKTENITVPVLK